MADVAEHLRHRPDAPTPGAYLREVQQAARRPTGTTPLMAGSVLAVLACLIASWFG